MENQVIDTKNTLLVPIAIVIAGVLVAGAVIYSDSGIPTTTESGGVQEQNALDAVRPVGSEDHILGNPDAPVVIVEYSDFECPFCKQFHYTMKQVMDKYGESGQVAWVFRHFPLDQLHPVKARAEAVASECVSETGGPDIFWKFADRFFELTPSNNQTNIEIVLPQIAQELNIDAQSFSTCMNSGKYDQHIESDIENAVETGGRGTPWSIVVTSSGKTFPLSGSQPYESVVQLIEIALKDK